MLEALPRSRMAAKELGAKHYYTGRECRRGHRDKRSAANGDCAACHREKVQARYRADPLTARAAAVRASAWRVANLERSDEIKRLWATRNPEKTRGRWADWSARNMLRRRLWRAENHQLISDLKRKRRARIRGAEGTFSTAETMRIRKQQKDRCAYCRSGLKGLGHLDHILAVAMGGSNWPRNLQWLCAPCNLSKGARDASDFARSRGLLI